MLLYTQVLRFLTGFILAHDVTKKKPAKNVTHVPGNTCPSIKRFKFIQAAWFKDRKQSIYVSLYYLRTGMMPKPIKFSYPVVNILICCIFDFNAWGTSNHCY